MLLAIDIGNTNIVFAVYDGNQQIQKWRHETNASVSAGLDSCQSDIQNVIVSSVVPSKNDELTTACEGKFNQTPKFVSAENVGIKIDLDDPKQAGADRLVNAVAVLNEYKKPAIIVDFGTATTFDVINADGAYAGGVIAPGINLSLKALGDAAAQLPDLKIEKPAQVIGKNTVDAMQSGIYWGYIGLIEGTIKRIQDEMGCECLVLATGGLAPLFAKGTDIIETIDPDLTLKGLVHIHKSLISN